MTHRKRDTSLGMGVYFAPNDYVGFARRLMILVVDSTVLIGIYIAFACLAMTMTGRFGGRHVLVNLCFVWMYLTIFKASRVRTVGY